MADVSYTVQPGDSLYLISQRYGTSVEAIKQANNLTGETIQTGQTLTLPTSGTTYTVKSGDSLYTIAQKYGVTVQALQQQNGLQSTTLQPGQQLVIPEGNQQTEGTIRYTVAPGDTYYTIGQRFGIPYREIMRVNQTTSTALTVGQVLVIPSPASPNSTDPASRDGANLDNPSSKDVALLARIAYSEARGEPYDGQVAVAAVVLNRVKNPLFPNTISEVVFEPGAFTAVSDGQFWLDPDQTAFRAAKDALSGRDPSGGALYYWNPAYATNNWVWSRKVITKIGNHVFAL